MSAKSILLEVVSGAEGPHISLSSDNGQSGYRIAGPKAWGGGRTIHKFNISPDELRRWLDEEFPVTAKDQK